MPEIDRAATLWVSAKNGAMKLHQSAWALFPCTKMRPGFPRSPHVSNSICAPRTGILERSGSIPVVWSNHAGAAGEAPANGAKGEAISGGRSGSSRRG